MCQVDATAADYWKRNRQTMIELSPPKWHEWKFWCATRFFVLSFGLLVFSTTAHGEIPCDFKGISVGDKITPDQIMKLFGISQFVINPKGPSFEEMQPLYDKYGIIGAAEIEDWKIGPYCEDLYCRIPRGVVVGNNDIPVAVFLSLRSGVITEIDVSFSAIFWDDVRPVIEKKYGSAWKNDQTDLVVSDYETKKSELLQRITAENRLSGVNPKTKDTCHMSLTNIDIVFTHHDPLGSLHSVFVLKLDSKNF
jgi:hypothetical protein